MNIISVDLETLGTKTNAVIASIGIAVVDAHTGAVVDKYKARIDVDQSGRSISSSTLAFWLNQSKDAQLLTFATNDEQCEKLHALPIAIASLNQFLARYLEEDATIWGNPATFDITILQNAFEQCGLPQPWLYWQVECLATLRRRASDAYRDIKFVGVKHDCLDDALHQAKIIRHVLQELES